MSSSSNILEGSNSVEAIQTLRFFCRHLVSLFVAYHQVDPASPAREARFFACPGTIICIRGIYHFLTAGHTLREWDTLIRRGQVEVQRAALADIFGLEVTSDQPIPFDFADQPRFFIHDEEEGLDFGLVALRSHYIRLLASHGIVAVFEENWIHQNNVEFNAYTMIGLPEEFTSSGIVGSRDNSRLLSTVAPTMISVRRLDQLPEDVRRTRYPRFVGQLRADLPLSSIRGMSGGPIFGFNFGPPMRYWVVAIQSSWLPRRRITFGCPVPVLADLIAGWTDELIDDEEFASPVDGRGDNSAV